jgi:hypothetical protein
MSKHVSAIVAAVVATLWAGPAAAQSTLPPVQVSFGYQLLHIPDETYPVGFAVDVSGRRTGLTWAAAFGWAHDDQNEPGVSGTLNFFDYGAGPRWTTALATAHPFVQLLVGGVHTSANLTENGSPFQAGGNAFMLQPGVGVVVPVGQRWGALVQGDYRRAFWTPQAENEFRFIFGVRLNP